MNSVSEIAIWSRDHRNKVKDLRSLIELSKELFSSKVYIQPSESDMEPITFKQLSNFVIGFEEYLHSNNIQAGERIAVLFANSSLMILLFLSIIANKNTFVPINNNCTPNEIDYILGDAKPQLFIYDAQMSKKIYKTKYLCKKIAIENYHAFINDIFAMRNPQVSHLDAPSSERPTEIVYTSGTTGNPKGVILTHKNLLADSFGIGDKFKYSENDHFLTITPLFHNSGQIFTTLVPLWCGGRTTAVRPDIGLSNLWYYTDMYGVTWSLGMPAHVNFLLENKKGNPSKRTMVGFFCGGMKLEIERQKEFENRFQIPIFITYGLTETTSFASFDLPDTRGQALGSVGCPMAINQIEIVKDGKTLPPNAVGEILIKGDNVIKEYLNRPETTKDRLKKGWLHTGDLGYLDQNGFLYVVDRIDNMLLVGGENVYPADVEKFVPQLEGVFEAVLSAIPHKILGKELVLIYKLKAGYKEDIQSWEKVLYSNLSSFKVPKKFIAVEDLGLTEVPKAQNGKILRHAIGECLSDFISKK